VALQQGQQVDQQLGHGFVLARLAGEDKQELPPLPAEYGIDDGPQRLHLVVVERQADDVTGEEADVGQKMTCQPGAVVAGG